MLYFYKNRLPCKVEFAKGRIKIRICHQTEMYVLWLFGVMALKESVQLSIFNFQLSTFNFQFIKSYRSSRNGMRAR